MPTYKGLEFPARVAPFLRHMASLNDHHEALRQLKSSWDTLALLGHLSDLQTDMTETRESFDGLSGRLLASLAHEHLARVVDGLGVKAQIAIDILVRNLFERTADIGFLATDRTIVAACRGGAAADAEASAALRVRFAAYVRRYTVYRDVVLLDPAGRRIGQLRDAPDATAPETAAEVLRSDGYVERFAPTPFTGPAPVLTYAAAVRDAGTPVGALALVFDLAGEAAVVFDKLREHEELVAFVDAGGAVVASSDPQTLPVGHRLPAIDGSALVRIGGANHVAVRRAATSYQGYAGPGWTAVALVPVDTAFNRATRAADVRFSGEGLYSADLLAVPKEADEIQRRLERIVWNGRLQRAGSGPDRFSRALLLEIASTGRRTKAVFDTSTHELLDTVAATLLDETRMLSGLAVDILDRNLFERACDCRWWAEDATLQSLAAEASAEVLAGIHRLYTVYTDILVFDAEGRTVASSAKVRQAGSRLDGEWVQRCLATRAELGYAVSAFVATELYDGRPTYVYAAPLRAGGTVVGGVALVFDAEPQFRAMLEAALPQRAGATAAFFDRHGTPIAALGMLPVAPTAEVLALPAGGSWSGFVAQGGRCYAVAATAGSGYREFKTRDGYQETVIAFVVVPCGTALAAPATDEASFTPVPHGTEVATFTIGSQSMGVPSENVVECIELDRSIRVPASLGTGAVGYAPWRGGMLPLVDIGSALGEAASGGRQAVVIETDGRHLGLLVSDLGPIVELEVSDLPMPSRTPDGRSRTGRIGRSGRRSVPLLSPAFVADVAGRA